MKRKRILAGLFGAMILAATLAVAFWPSRVDAGAGDCVLAETQFASGGPATCKVAKQQCRDELDSRLQWACTGIRYTGEICDVGPVSFSSCTGPRGQKVVDCQRDVYCVEAALPF